MTPVHEATITHSYIRCGECNHEMSPNWLEKNSQVENIEDACKTCWKMHHMNLELQAQRNMVTAHQAKVDVLCAKIGSTFEYDPKNHTIRLTAT